MTEKNIKVKTKESLIEEIKVLQSHLNKYLDLRSPLRQIGTSDTSFNKIRYQKLSQRSLTTIIQSLREQLNYYKEAEENPINIKKPKNMPTNIFFDIFLSADMAIIIENNQEEIVLINQKACNLFEYSAHEFLKLKPRDLQYVTKEKTLVPIYNDENLNRFTTFEAFFKKKSGEIFPGEIRLIRLEYNNSQFIVAMISDLIARKKIEEQQKQLIKDLQEALDNIQKLRGLLPICGMCKKIRSDGGYWNQIDTFVQDMSDLKFSLELCPDCRKKNWHIILSYFDSFFGPIVLINQPKGEIDENLRDISMLLDFPREGFFEISMDNAKILNLQKEIASPLARGNSELMMISFVVIDGDLNFEVGKKIINDFLEKLLEIENLELVFSFQNQKTPEGMKVYRLLEKIMFDVYNSIEETMHSFLSKNN